ncbi:MAG TPA: proline dehydrogenase family protein [Flavobacteriaceae bacterium]|nr:proline dehydrogenase family protein [Flavobacteriaceae bacterium]
MESSKLFDDTQTAFSLKSKSELNQSYLIFKLISSPILVSIGTKLTLFSLKTNLPIKGLVKHTIFRQFCGGETEQDCLKSIHLMYEKKVHAILDYSVEGKENEADFDAALKKKLELVAFAKTRKEIPFVVLKPTALARFALWVKVSSKEELTESESQEWQRVVARFDAICKATYEAHSRVMVDAEESWMQDAVDQLVEQMMQRYNKDRVTVFNTLQCYRWDRLDYLKKEHNKARTLGYKLGMKIVRGAYMEKERERAQEKGYPSPICASKNDTDTMFNEVLTYIVNHLDEMELFVGTHNEASCYLALDLIKEKGIAKNTDKIWFGQLFGMSDHITFNLASNGYNNAKLIPFGPVNEVIPYLIRRAEENTSVAGQTGRELTLLMKERKRRKAKA